MPTQNIFSRDFNTRPALTADRHSVRRWDHLAALDRSTVNVQAEDANASARLSSDDCRTPSNILGAHRYWSKLQ